MSVSASDISDGVVLIGSQFSEPMRVVGNPAAGDGFVLVNLVGTRTSNFRGGVTLTKTDLGSIRIERKEVVFGGKPRLFKLGLEALRISLAQEYDPYSEHKSERYRLGELMRDKTAHFLLLTATPHKGDPANFSLFLQLLDQEVYADVKSIHDAMERRECANRRCAGRPR